MVELSPQPPSVESALARLTGSGGAVLKDGAARAAVRFSPTGVKSWLPSALGGATAPLGESPAERTERVTAAPAAGSGIGVGAASRGAVTRGTGAVLEEAHRFLAAAGEELARARAEAERLRREAQARLEEAGETIATAADARALLERSRAETAAARVATESEAQRVLAGARAAGHAAGFEAGQSEGRAAAEAGMREALELAHGVAAAARIDRARLVAGAEGATVRLAVDIARTLIGREVAADPDVLRDAIARALQRAAGEDRVRLRLHPATIATLGDTLSEVTARFASRGVDVVPDPAVDERGVVVDTRAGRVDAGVETGLGAVERALLDLAGEERPA